VVICSELPSNEGSSVTYSAHQIAAEVIRYHKLKVPRVWIEHYPEEATDGTTETFELVAFSSYEVKEKAPYLGETRLTIGEPIWKSLDRESVEALVGQEVLASSLARRGLSTLRYLGCGVEVTSRRILSTHIAREGCATYQGVALSFSYTRTYPLDGRSAKIEGVLGSPRLSIQRSSWNVIFGCGVRKGAKAVTLLL
jgi:hypothetical protein